MHYLLSEPNRLHFESRAEWSAVSAPRKAGYFRLFNKNSNQTLYVRVIDQVPNCYQWVVELHGPVPDYFQHILQPLPNEVSA